MIVLTDFEAAVGIKLTGQHCVSFPGQVTHLTGHCPRISQRAIFNVSVLGVVSSRGERTSRLDDLTFIHSLEEDTGGRSRYNVITVTAVYFSRSSKVFNSI